MIKKILAVVAVLVLAGCITLVNPPESSYNGLYLQMYETTGGFIAQLNLNSYKDCALIAANFPSLGKGKITGFCTKQNNPNVTYKATLKDPGAGVIDALFVSLDACGKFLIDGAKENAFEAVKYCAPITP